MHVGMATFFQNLGQRISDHAVYRHEISMADLAEPLGFDSIWGAEHHFDDYTMCPNVAQFLTYMAARTMRVKLGSMVMVLPWHNLLRFAEEISVLDDLSGSRVILGIGRGLGRIEFRGFRVAMSESRGRFSEYASRRAGRRRRIAAGGRLATTASACGAGSASRRDMIGAFPPR